MAKRNGFVHLPHTKAVEQHALKRMFQRFGFSITTADYRELCAMCADGRAPVVTKARTGGTFHRFNFRGREIYAIFRADYPGIVTFLSKPQEILNAHQET